MVDLHEHKACFKMCCDGGSCIFEFSEFRKTLPATEHANRMDEVFPRFCDATSICDENLDGGGAEPPLHPAATPPST